MIHPLNIQACLHVPVCEYKREDSDFKDYTGQKGFIQTGETELTNFQNTIVSPSLKV